MEYIEINLHHPTFTDASAAPAALGDAMRDARGSTIRFSNGCILCLEEETGMYWGDAPDGVLWACAAADGWEEAVLRWLAFWNARNNDMSR